MATFKRDYRTDYDINDPELSARWDEVIEDLHASGCPVARSEVGEGYWVVNSYDGVNTVAKDWETYSSADGFMVNRPEGMPYFAPAEVDPPLQTKLRAALEPFLRPKAVAAHEPAIRAAATEMIDRFIETGQVELVSQFANPLPQAAFSRCVAGMPESDMPHLLTAFSFVGPEEERAANFAGGMERVGRYLEQRKEEPARGDIVDALLAFEHEGYGWMDKVGTMCQLTIGGVGTTGYAFSGGLHHLATHEDDRQWLLDDLTRIPKALEEFLRHYLGVPQMARRATRDAELHGVRIARGDRVLLSFGAASRDPAVCPFPHEVKLDQRARSHAFGAGLHRCIGVHLARLTLRVGYEEFLRRIPDFETVPGFAPSYETGSTRHMVELPLTFTPGEKAGSQATVEEQAA